DLVHEHARLRRVAVIDRRAIGRETDTVGERYPAVELFRLPRCVDPPALAGHALALELEGVRLHRTRVDAALSVGEQIIEAGRIVAREQYPSRTVPHVTDVLSRDHEPAVRVQGDPANAAALGDDGVDGAVGSPPVHAASRHVAEIQV